MKTRLQVGDLELDLLTRTAQRNGTAIDLQPREFRLLEYLMRHAGQVVTRTMLLESGVGVSFRSADQCDRRAYLSPARRRSTKASRRLCCTPCAALGYMIRARA